MEPGAVVGGKYRLVRKVGKGGMGTVWAASQIFTDAPVAVKLLSAEAAASDEMRTRLVREAGAARRIKHPNVVDFLEVGVTDDGEPFLVMELLQGQTLRQLIRDRGKLEPEVALWIACEVARALMAAHKAEIAHRDLKPGNIFLHRDLNGHLVVKVLDFGVSKFLAEEHAQMTSTGAAIGSPAYMSPEQAKGDRVDHRTDIWSLGILLFEMLAGQRPFVADSPVAMLSLILFGRIPRVNEFAPEIDPVVDAIIARCLERRVEARYQQVDQVLEALETRRAAMAEAESPDRNEALSSWVDQTTTVEPLEAPNAQSWSTSAAAQSTSQSASVNASSQSASTAGMSASLPIPPMPITDAPFPPPEPKPTVPLLALIIPGLAVAGFFVAVVVLLIRYSTRHSETTEPASQPPASAVTAAQTTEPAPAPTPESAPSVIPIPSASLASSSTPDAATSASASPTVTPVKRPKTYAVPQPTEPKTTSQPKKACKSPIVDSDGKVVGCLD